MKYLILVLVLVCAGCGRQLTSATNSEQLQLRDHFREVTKMDSVLVVQRDSVYIRERADTVFVERWHTLISYRDRLRVDTMRVSDTVRIIETVSETATVEVNRLTGWQWFQLWCGRILILAGFLTAVYLAFKWKLKS